MLAISLDEVLAQIVERVDMERVDANCYRFGIPRRIGFGGIVAGGASSLRSGAGRLVPASRLSVGVLGIV